jgi:hypothetical protein
LLPHSTKEAWIDTSILISFAGTVPETVHVIHCVFLNDDFLVGRDKHVNTSVDTKLFARRLGDRDQIVEDASIWLRHFAAKVKPLHGICMLLSYRKFNRCLACPSRFGAVTWSETPIFIQAVPLLINLCPACTLASTIHDHINGSNFAIKDMNLVLAW